MVLFSLKCGHVTLILHEQFIGEDEGKFYFGHTGFLGTRNIDRFIRWIEEFVLCKGK